MTTLPVDLQVEVAVDILLPGAEVVVDHPGATLNVPGPTGPQGPQGIAGVVTYPTGGEPDMQDLPDGTLCVEYEP
jgi:hypothetical protein